MHFLDKMPEHRLGDLKVGDDTVFEWADGDDIAGRSPEHSLRFVTHSQNLAGSSLDCDDRRLSKNDAVILDVNERICGS